MCGSCLSQIYLRFDKLSYFSMKSLYFYRFMIHISHCGCSKTLENGIEFEWTVMRESANNASFCFVFINKEFIDKHIALSRQISLQAHKWATSRRTGAMFSNVYQKIPQPLILPHAVAGGKMLTEAKLALLRLDSLQICPFGKLQADSFWPD